MSWQRWKPRQPSPKVYRHIFGNNPAGEVSFGFRDLSRWLVPAFGCFLLVVSNLTTHLQGRYSLQMSATNLPALSNIALSTIPGAQRHSGVNSFPAREYAINFAARPSTAATSAGSILISYTNGLIQ